MYNNKRRLAIFFFYDRDGVVDEYILYMLKDLHKNVAELLVVCNGNLSTEGRVKLESITNKIFVRQNVGFDVWAYKEGLEYYGWDKLSDFYEVILLNFTNFGPLYPFKEMFDEMDKRELDFWGITKHNGHDFDPYKKCKYGYIPAHIQSSFISVRKNMLNSKDFHHYWENMPMINSYEESICYHEAVFTEDFTRMGYKSDVYINTDDLKDFSDYPLMLYPKELVENRRCPIIKRKSFFNHYEEFLDISCGQSTYELYEYIKNNLDYDVGMIWKNLLRTANMYDIKMRMQLNYILSTSTLEHNQSTSHPRVALFMHIYFEDMIEYCKRYANSMPAYADIYISTSSVLTKKKIEESFDSLPNRVTVVMVENRGRDVSGFLIGLKPYYDKYDYVCYAHDKKSFYSKPYIQGESFAYHCFENILASKMFVENVIKTFEKDQNLGLLVPPPPCHGDYYYLVGLEWQSNFKNVAEYARKIGLTVDIANTKPPIAPFGSVFWFRSCSLKLLFDQDFKYEDFPEEPCKDIDGNFMHTIERIYPFIAQQAGYYSAWLLSDTFARLEITNLYKMLRDANETLFWNFGVTGRHALLNMISTTKTASEILALKIDSFEKSKILVRKIFGNQVYSFLRDTRNRLIRLLKDRS